VTDLLSDAEMRRCQHTIQTRQSLLEHSCAEIARLVFAGDLAYLGVFCALAGIALDSWAACTGREV